MNGTLGGGGEAAESMVDPLPVHLLGVGELLLVGGDLLLESGSLGQQVVASLLLLRLQSEHLPNHRLHLRLKTVLQVGRDILSLDLHHLTWDWDVGEELLLLSPLHWLDLKRLLATAFPKVGDLLLFLGSSCQVQKLVSESTESSMYILKRFFLAIIDFKNKIETI